MRVTPIPDGEIMDGTTRLVVGPPQGDPPDGSIRPVEMLLQAVAGFPPIYRARVILEDGDAERLAAGEPFWLSFWGQVVPFDVAMTADPEATTPPPFRPPTDAEARRAQVITDALAELVDPPTLSDEAIARLSSLLRLPDES